MGGLTGRDIDEIGSRAGHITDRREAMVSTHLERVARRLRKPVLNFIIGKLNGDRLFRIKFQAEWDKPAVAQVGAAVHPVHLESRGIPIGILHITIC